MDRNTSTSTGEGEFKAERCELIATPSLSDKLPGYAPDPTREIFRPEVLKFIEECVDGYNDELRELSLKIHGQPWFSADYSRIGLATTI